MNKHTTVQSARSSQAPAAAVRFLASTEEDEGPLGRLDTTTKPPTLFVPPGETVKLYVANPDPHWRVVPDKPHVAQANPAPVQGNSGEGGASLLPVLVSGVHDGVAEISLRDGQRQTLARLKVIVLSNRVQPVHFRYVSYEHDGHTHKTAGTAVDEKRTIELMNLIYGPRVNITFVINSTGPLHSKIDFAKPCKDGLELAERIYNPLKKLSLWPGFYIYRVDQWRGRDSPGGRHAHASRAYNFAVVEDARNIEELGDIMAHEAGHYHGLDDDKERKDALMYENDVFDAKSDAKWQDCARIYLDQVCKIRRIQL